MEKFDVFLCHHSKDKPAVIEVAEQLQQRGIVPWLDIWHLRPGFSWQDSLDEQINEIQAAAVFVGNSGFGPWQDQEIKAFIRAFVNRKCPVIPVLLPDAPQEPQLPVFLQGLTWVDFRQQNPDPMEQLIWGITSKKPGTTPVIQRQSPTILPKREFIFMGDISPSKRDLDDLSSEKGINYTTLRDLLAAKKWKKADQETYRVMIQAVGKEVGFYFTSDELLNFPCTDLRTIDRLWVKYSNGHFGFSVQKKIYLSVGGFPNKYYKETWEKFGDRVGWRVNSSWIYYIYVTFDISSPKGHLPNKVASKAGGHFLDWFGEVFVLGRLLWGAGGISGMGGVVPLLSHRDL
ncbi:GUN4 domain-containing protein [Nostoc sp. UHCC 0251]|uniref:GUN4 domain-containing protein n=1 Tax=Nostoc sp. UHCC 0251 TaxID=3110240 RepID=UPI002B20077A|nr:GUN4 domain-containing protein [Nostoc sp. UHCC 0251]MEA5624095.1 GUN4 domain-containing protein [Nostoc sp. UHCC 0251]